MLSNQGVVSISDTGVEIKSDPIKNLIDYLTGPLLDHTKDTAFAEGYETEKKYILASLTTTPMSFARFSTSSTTSRTAWTYWDRSLYAMHVAQNEDRLLYREFADSPTVSRERHDGNDGDLCDEDLNRTIVSVSGVQVEL
jgi:hypothetical protein